LKTIILYATRHGAAKEAAAFLSARLGDVEVLEIGRDLAVDLDRYDTVVVGGSIHAGSVQRAVKRLLAESAEVLLSKRLGLYLCCLYEGATAKEQLEGAFPEALRDHAAALGLFGGRLDFDKMSDFERAVVQKVAGVTESVSKMNTDAMQRFVDQLTGRESAP
jgi:menaquinone-dependent protoporphyrinogen oxidase